MGRLHEFAHEYEVFDLLVTPPGADHPREAPGTAPPPGDDPPQAREPAPDGRPHAS